MLLEIDESFTKSFINLLKDGFESERDRGVVASCLGDGSSSYKKALYESEIARVRNNYPIRFFLSGEILGCAIALVYGTKCKCKI